MAINITSIWLRISHKGFPMQQKVIITCAVTGAGDTVGAIVVEGIIKHSVHGLQGQVLNALLHKAAIAAGITCSRAGAQPPRAHELVEAMEK
jgi:fructokinase